MKYFITIAKEKYDCYYQYMNFLGLFTTLKMGIEQIEKHSKNNYMYGCLEYDYYIFFSDVNEFTNMKESDCIYSMTSNMCKPYEIYIHPDFQTQITNNS